MIFLRSTIFNLLFFGWTAILAFCFLPLLLFPRKKQIFLQRFWTKSMAWLLEHVVGITAEIRGREHMPSGPCIIASKHQSAWETMAYVFILDNPSFIIKREILFIPIFGLYVWRAHLVPINRKAGVRAVRQMLRRAREVLSAGRSIIMFPEGTRVAPGSHRPYHPGIVALYSHLHVPVVPVALNSGLFWRRRSFIKRPGKIVLEFLPPIQAGLEKKAFLVQLERRIEDATTELLA